MHDVFSSPLKFGSACEWGLCRRGCVGVGAVKAFCFLADLENRKAGPRVDNGRRVGFFPSLPEKYLFATHYQLKMFELV